jgi:hypothetical protein
MDDAEHVEELQRRWMQAWVEVDLETCEQLLAPEFRLRSVATDTIVDRAEWLRQVREGRVRATGFSYDEMAIEVVGDTAVTMSRTTQQAKIADRDWSATLNVTDVWVRRNGTWQVVARHASRPAGAGGEMSA